MKTIKEYFMPVGNGRPEEDEHCSLTSTYSMRFICYNCGTSFDNEIPLGESPKGKGGICPHCNVKDGNTYRTFKHFKPI